MGSSVTFNQRLLAEAVCVYEDERGIVEDADALHAARALDGDLEQRIVARAGALAVAEPIQTALQQMRNVVALLAALSVVILALTGVTTTQVALWPLQDGEATNFFWLLTTILGLPIVTLLLWMLLILTRPAFMSASSIGGLIYSLSQRVSQRAQKRAQSRSAALAGLWASASVYGKTTIGTWTLSAISHASWLAFTGGSFLIALLLLSVRQYSFAWETTILSADSYIALTRLIALLPEMLGFSAPSAAQIAASAAPAGAVEASAAWSGLLLGSIFVYGVMPRALLLGFSLIMRWRAMRRFRLDLDYPGYARWHDQLMPLTRSLGVIDADDSVAAADPAPADLAIESDSESAPPKATGPAAIVGLEIDPPEQWPPLDGIDWLDLGFIDDRSDRMRVLAALDNAPSRPCLLLIVCSLTTTPDRGIRRFIATLGEKSQAPLALLLTGGQRMRDRGEGDVLAQRSADWRSLGKSAGVAENNILDLDFDHLTAASRARLNALVDVQYEAQRTDDLFADACACILEHVKNWSGYPDEAQQALLHQALADLYRGKKPAALTALFKPLDLQRNIPDQLQRGADRVLGLLPPRLRVQPRWLATGALAGAMGCVALTGLISATAITTLPIWAGAGAALALFAKRESGTAGAAEKGAVTDALDLSQPVDSAALFALLLELQGRDETDITRLLGQIIDEPQAPINDVEGARQRLQEMRRRVAQALAVHAA